MSSVVWHPEKKNDNSHHDSIKSIRKADTKAETETSETLLT